MSVILAANLLIGCAPESPMKVSKTADPLLDLSSWDFGDQESSNNGLHQTETTFSEPDKSSYAIAVATFTGPASEANAQNTLINLKSQFPNLGARLQVRERSRGFVLAFGNYTGFGDSQAKEDILVLRNIVDKGGQLLFGQVLLTKFRTPLSKRRIHPNDLWSVRKDYPTVVPIYTLEIALWGDFESGQFPTVKRRRAAETLATELRNKGFEAFFLHNDDRGLSSVSVGLFNYQAVDAETGFYSPEVEAMIARFPERLINGEQIYEYLDSRNHALGTRAQPPVLVEVPVD